MVMDLLIQMRLKVLDSAESLTYVEPLQDFHILVHIYLRTIQLNLCKAEYHAYTFSIQFAQTSAKPNNMWHRMHNVKFLHLLSAKTSLYTPHIIHIYEKHITSIQLIILLITQQRHII